MTASPHDYEEVVDLRQHLEDQHGIVTATDPGSVRLVRHHRHAHDVGYFGDPPPTVLPNTASSEILESVDRIRRHLADASANLDAIEQLALSRQVDAVTAIRWSVAGIQYCASGPAGLAELLARVTAEGIQILVVAREQRSVQRAEQQQALTTLRSRMLEVASDLTDEMHTTGMLPAGLRVEFNFDSLLPDPEGNVT